ncbi:MAG: radical SAM protein [Syntrophaceae bacterium]|nr:radical SAM protein [Syntrophaceae bacterium]
MSDNVFKYLYGPVPSRRLGRSLGIDLVPFKTCTYDCIYCQLGRTTHKTVERRSYAPIHDILNELEMKLVSGETPDYISIAGSGEPTLHSEIGGLIGGIKELTNIPVAVLTNGSLLYLPEIREDLMRADLVIPSLDAGDQTIFQYVNRPHRDISFDNLVNGLMEFTEVYSGQVWLEVLLVSGVTGMAADVEKIALWANRIGPSRVQLNTVCRPAAEDYACAVQRKQMENFAGLFSGTVELIGEDDARHLTASAGRTAADKAIISLLSRRPSTLSGICAGLGLHPHDAAKILGKLSEDKQITMLRMAQDVFYKIAERDRS